jgi:hypothetical protein
VAPGILVQFCSQPGLLAACSREKSLSHLQVSGDQVREVREVEGLPTQPQQPGALCSSTLPHPGGELSEEEGASQVSAASAAWAHGTPKGPDLASRCFPAGPATCSGGLEMGVCPGLLDSAVEWVRDSSQGTGREGVCVCVCVFSHAASSR